MTYYRFLKKILTSLDIYVTGGQCKRIFDLVLVFKMNIFRMTMFIYGTMSIINDIIHEMT